MKTCGKCKQELPLSAFGERIQKGTRRVHCYCKKCTSIVSGESFKRRKMLGIHSPSIEVPGEVLGVEEGRQFKSPKDFIKFKKLKLELAEFKRGRK